ncbi:protein kinase domain-containing protein [Actinomadura oligospora]|uniref:protein kinase domain-containing protein n=1 Tax=Actinomadura oligospora TaxID=111804 RepID=UPI0004B889DC|nr:hypothetical protein [Actinomadura oligospora]
MDASAPSLRDLIRDDGPLSSATVRTLAADLARLLATSTAAHGGLSPDTILLTRDGPRLAAAVTPDPAYTPPEQTRDHDLIPPTDIFALGAVLAYAATGRAPFGEGPPELLAYRIAYHAPDLNGLPDDLRELIASCLDKSPSARPTATEITLQARPTSALDPLSDAFPEPAWPENEAETRAALLSQAAGSMRAVLTNSAAMFAALHHRQATPPRPWPAVRPQALSLTAEAPNPAEYRCVPSPHRNHPYSMTITTSTTGKQLLYTALGVVVGWKLAPERDVLTVGPEGLQVRQRGRTRTRRRPTTFHIDWDDLKTIRVITENDAVRVVATFTSPGQPNWFRDNNIRHFDGGYELYKTPSANHQETTALATQIRQALTPFTEPTD